MTALGKRAESRRGVARFETGLRAAAHLARAKPAVERHLILGYRPGWQSLEDLNTIARHVGDIDPTIRSFILPTTHRNLVTRREAAGKPTLVVSAGRMLAFQPMRGKVYQGWPIPKFEEVRRLATAGVPVPMTAIIRPQLKLDPAVWGEFVVVKPTDIGTSSHGLGVQLMRTHRVRYIAPGDYPKGHPGRLGPMLVQQYIDTGDRLSSYRVLTFMGEPVSAVFQAARVPKVNLDLPDEELERAPIAIQTLGPDRDRALVDSPAILNLARAAHAAIPEIPLKGCDILREAATGRYYVIELNCGGNTWHFSSKFFAETRERTPDFEVKRRRQFDVFRTSARVLVERANAEAV